MVPKESARPRNAGRDSAQADVQAADPLAQTVQQLARSRTRSSTRFLTCRVRWHGDIHTCRSMRCVTTTTHLRPVQNRSCALLRLTLQISAANGCSGLDLKGMQRMS